MSVVFLRKCLFAILLSVVAVTGESNAQLKNKIVGTPIYSVKIGDKFVYSIVETRPGKKNAITTRSTLTETVVDLDGSYEGKGGARKLIRDTVTNNSVYYLTSPGVSFAMNEPLGVSSMRSAGLWKTYPLAIAKGKSIQLPTTETVIDLGSSKATTKNSCTMSILGIEKLKVGKTVYNCIKIAETVTEEVYSETGGKGASGKVKRTKPKKTVRVATLWYSPELQTLIKYSTKQGNQSFTQYLTKYIPAPKRTAMLETR